jgi:carboxymethylenebutenolidase
MCHPVDESVVYHNSAEQQLEMPGSGHTIPVFAYKYDLHDRRPVVVIIHDAYGASPFYRDMGRRLAGQGFAAMLPDLFCREGPLTANTLEAAMERGMRHARVLALEDLRAITDRLSNEGRNVGVIGFCMGGTYAFLAASRMPGVKASVVYYGYPVTPRLDPNPIDEINRVHAPILGFFGEADAFVTVDNVRAYEEAAREAEKEIGFTIYPDLGHDFLTFEPEGPGVEASQKSWSRTTSFFKDHLGKIEGDTLCR